MLFSTYVIPTGIAILFLLTVSLFEQANFANSTQIGLTTPFKQAVVNVVNSSNSTQLIQSNQTNTTSTTQYSNYTSDKYQIQFQYPADWEITEKTNRFEEGTDITIKKIAFDNPGAIMISYDTDLVTGFGSNDFTTAFYNAFKDSIGADYSQEYRVIEQPKFLDIDGQKAGTFLFSMKDKYEDSPSVFGVQNWLVFIGKHHGYLIGFWSPTDYFDSPENAEIRDHFIKSIKFFGTNVTNNNTPNRFG